MTDYRVLDISAAMERLLRQWTFDPVAFVREALGGKPDAWQSDVLIALSGTDNVAIRACHGVGKTTLLAWAIIHFVVTRPFSKAPTTAPTFNKQVQDILWGEIHKWWRAASGRLPWLTEQFVLNRARLAHAEHSSEWFAVGIPSNQPLNIEGYHAEHLLVVFDEAKGIAKPTWDAIQGMRTTQEAKFLVASTPGGPTGEFFKIFTHHRQTWRSLFVVRPEALRETLQHHDRAAPSPTRTYLSSRVRSEWVTERALEWGPDSPVYIARVRGDFPDLAGDVLVPYAWLSDAEDREQGKTGLRWVACDVARYGRDRTVVLVGEGGTLLHGETIARTPEACSALEVWSVGVGADPRRPAYRALDVVADACQRLRRQFQAQGITIDDTGIGGGVVDMLKRRGEHVVPINFGAAPTDKPRDADERASRQRRHLLDSNFANLKAQMGWALHAGFELGELALARLPRAILDPLIAQTSMVKQEVDPAGRIRIVDPDDQDELAATAGTTEGRKSPDHFHALLLYWWVASGRYRGLTPRAGTPQLPPHVTCLGVPRTGTEPIGRAVTRAPAAGWGDEVGGQAKYVRRY